MDGDGPSGGDRRSPSSLILDEQGEGWGRGDRPPVEEFLARNPALLDESEAVLDLIYHEFLIRRSLGESPDPVEFIRRFPALAPELIRQFAVHEAIRGQGASTVVHDGPSATARPPGSGPPVDVEGYEVESELGRGAMGVVYRARQLRPSRLVALKFLLGGGHAGSSHLARVRTEADAIAQLGHDNIIRIYAVGERDGVPFLALEFVDGGNLADVLAGKPRPPAEAAGLVRTLAEAIAHAHAHQIIHRDLKPSNVLLTVDGKPKISDFGLAKILGDAHGATLSGFPMGTPSYMAPEQAEGRTREIGPLADIYALGAILYEALTGRAPFLGGSTIETLKLVVTAEVVPPSRLLPDVPRDLETICLKCLEKDPRRRHADARALAEDLRRFLAGETILARPVGAPGRAWRWCRRNPRLAGLAASLAATFLLGTPTMMALWLRAVAEGRRAEVERDRAEKSLDRAQRVVAEILVGNETGDLTTEEMRPFRKELVAAGLRHSLELIRELEGNPRTESLLIDAHIAMAKMQVETGEAGLADQNYRKAVDLAERAVARDPKSAEARLKLCMVFHQIVRASPNGATSQAATERSNALIRALIAEGHDVMPRMIGQYLVNCHNLGHYAHSAGRHAEAARDFQEGLRAGEEQLRRGPLGDPELAEMARLELYLCRVYRHLSPGRERDEVDAGLRCVAGYEAVSRRQPGKFDLAMQLVTAYREVALAYKYQHKDEDSVRFERKARAALLAIAVSHGGLVSRMTQVQEILAVVDYNLTLMYSSDPARHREEGRELIREAHQICQKLSLVKPLSVELRLVHASASFDLAESQAEDGEAPDLGLYLDAERTWEGLLRENPASMDARTLLVVVRLRLADELARRGRLDEARRYDREAPASSRGSPENFVKIAGYFADVATDLGKYQARLGPEQKADALRRARGHLLRMLREASADGFRDARRIEDDPTFAGHLDDPDLRAILGDMAFPGDPFARP